MTSSWHALPATEALALLGSSPDGLGSSEAEARRARFGDNRIEPVRRKRLAGDLVESLVEPLQLLLIAIGTLSLLFGELRDAIVIFAIIGAVGALEATTELRARRALGELRSLSAPRARVFRDGSLAEVQVDELVPGDVVALAAGDLVPADCRVLEGHGLALDESALTGEVSAASKGTAPVDEAAPLAERSSICHAGTAVVAGEGRGLVVATGEASELGRLRRMVAEEREPPSPLARAMAELARAVLLAAIAVSALVPLLGLVRGQPFREMLLDGLALAFATIPEELPILVSVLLAVGGRRLARRGALVRRLRAGETIGAVTAVVTDKTGTLTENRLRLAGIEGERERVLRLALASAREDERPGDPLDDALVAAAQQAGIGRDARLAAFPFDPERKRMSVVTRDGGGASVAAKGAPEAILERSVLSAEERERALALVERLAGEGLRVVAFAQRPVSAVPQSAEEAERELELVGFASFDDPLRPGVGAAVEALERAGVATLVVTGDHASTAAAVAARAGVGDGELLLGGPKLAALADDELRQRLRHGTVIARATPADKLRVVRLLQGRGELVGVTGDGVNDAPALAAADVGIAMGKRGTGLAREAADLVLTDDAFPTIEAAVEGGRALASQLRRAVAFYLGAKVALVAAMALSLALGLPAPFRPVQIVLLELFMDLGASVAFVSEPSAPGAMRRPPRDPARRFLDRIEAGAILFAGASLFAGVAAAFFVTRALEGARYGGSAAFAAWLLGHAAVAWTLRARPRLPLRGNLFFPLWALSAAGAAVMLSSSPVGAAVELEPLPLRAWPVVVAAAGLSFLLALTARRAARLGERL